MSVTRTFTVTVVSTGSGNKYFIDGVQQDTVNLAEGYTYKFDQSDSSNGTHPLRLSTTIDGTHNGGSEYTTGVTTNGTPGNSGAYTQITVAASAPTLYYYCTAHSGMGGTANTPAADTWGLLPWNQNSWGQQDGTTVAVTGVSASTALGTPAAFPAQGWGRQQWGNSGWGVEYSVAPTGLSMTSSVPATVEAAARVTVELTGLSTTSSVGDPTTGQITFVTPTGQQAQTELGDFDNAGTLVGWGRNGWGEEPYGDSFNKLVQLAGVSSTASNGSLTLDLTSVISLTGQSATSFVGALTFNLTSVITPTGQSATTSVGSLTTEIGQTLAGQSATSSVGGIILDALTEQPTGQQATTSVGSLTVGVGIPLTGVSATVSVGSIIPAIGVPLTGVSATSAVGTISPTPMTVGLTGQLATSSVGTDLILKYYGKLDPKTSTGYSTKTPKTSVSGYSTKTPKNTTGYTTKTA